MKKNIFIVTIILATLIIGFKAQAQWWRGFGRGGMDSICLDYPPLDNLAQDQKKSYNSLYRSFLKETASLNAEIDQKQLEMRALLMETEPDSKKISKLQSEISELQSEYDKKTLFCQLKARKILTPDQIENLPQWCGMGFGISARGQGPAYGCGQGCRMGSGYNRWSARNHGRGYCW